MQRRLVAGVSVGAAVIAVIGFVGSYAAVRTLAEAKHFGAFALVFPIGIDAGILVLLALDLLLTWLRMQLAMLRHTAWLLTAATIAFNGAAAWPDPIGTGMHAVIPILFVVVVEAARHAIGIAADLTAARHMESVRWSRWLLAPWSTFRLWRRMKLWELRSYDEVIALEQQRLIERMRLRARYGWRWRSKAPVEARLALRLTRYGRPLAPVDDAPALAPVTPPVPDEYAPEWSEPTWGEPEWDAPEWDEGTLERPAPELPPPPPAAPERPAPAAPPRPEGAPQRPAPADAPERPAPAPEDASHPPDDEGAPERPDSEGDDEVVPSGGEQQPTTREEAKRKIGELFDEGKGRPTEGQIVALLKRLDRYPYTSRRHAQKLRDEVEADRKRAERASADDRVLTPV
ncbi:DUF2637 domain-containing protein [Streptomyces sp. NBC_00582]|nr:DUF2637 domain-containing protein [Streptomyces sp. NBC_00582]WUB68101.1 DUF2637 domain-containing protein [Streptomyces sp. NBC_00582]